MSTLACTIDGNSVGIVAGSFAGTQTVNNRPVGNITVYYQGNPVGNEGDEVIIMLTSDNSKVFAGRIQTVNSRTDMAGVTFAQFGLGGYETLADRRIVAEVYTNKTAGFIVNDLITKYLAADGVTAGTIGAGITIPRAVFGYIQLSEALRSLADASGYVWYINVDKELVFEQRGTQAAPQDIDIEDMIKPAVRNVSVQGSLNQYRNRQFIQYNELTDLRTELFIGNGATQTFGVEFPIEQKPEILVNGIAQTVGIQGLSDTSQWYWSKGDNNVAQEPTDEPVGDDWSINYIGVDTNAQIGISITARGQYAVNAIGTTSELALYQISDKFGALLQTFPTGYDTIHGVTFIDEEYLALTYADAGTDYIRLVRRVGDSLDFAGSPVSTANPMLLSAECSNGEYVAASEENTADSLNLYKFSKSAQTLTLVETVTRSGSTQNPCMVWYGDYLAYACFDDKVNVYKLDRSTDTLTSIYGYSEGVGTQVSSVAWIDKYLYSGFSNLSGSVKNKIIRHSLDVSTDTLTRLGTVNVTDINDSQWIVSINTNLFVIARGFPTGGNFYEVSLDDGSLTYRGDYPYPGNVATVGLSAVRNAGASFVIGIASLGLPPIFIGKPAGGIISVTYRGTFPNITQVDEFTEQASRATLEGGTGIYESFQSAGDVDGEAVATDIGRLILERYGRIPRIFNFETQLAGFGAGQKLEVNWPSLGVNNEDFVIESVTARDEAASVVFYSVRCISGSDFGNWQNFWRSIKPIQNYDFGRSDTVPQTRAVQDMVMAVDEVTAASAVAQVNWDEGNWDQMEWQ